MRLALLLPYYFHWHYTHALVSGARITENFVWFFWHFFSIGDLVKTLFKPWQRLHEERHGGSIEDFFTVWLINALMIMAGVMIRITMIAFGFVFIIVTIAFGIIGLALWLILPLIIVVSFVTGLVLLFNPQ